MTIESSLLGSTTRRGALRTAVGTAAVGTMLLAAGTPAQAQTATDIDALNLMLNMEYLLAQFISQATGDAVPLDRLTSNGVAGTPVRPGRPLTFSDLALRTVVAEMGGDNRNHLLPIRVVIGALSARQPLIDISAGATSPFTALMQQAGVVAAGATFDPYASEENFLYALFFLKNMSVAAYRGLAATISNRVVVQNFTGILGAEAIHAATVRTYLYTRGATLPRLRQNADRIAAYQNTLNGGGVFQGLSPIARSTPAVAGTVTTARISPAQSNGSAGGRSAAQTLNQLYLTSSAATAGGFFPEGVSGNIRTSASA